MGNLILADSPLRQAVERFARLVWPLSEASLERPWIWGDYDEGVRFAFFRIYEDLRQLAVELHASRQSSASPLTPAQHILAQYHVAYLDLLAVLLSANDALAEQEPDEGQWPLRMILAHIIDAERGFYFTIKYALERARGTGQPPLEQSEEGWLAFWKDDPFEAQQETASMSELLAYYAWHHQRVIVDFAGVSQDELRVLSTFWESTPMPVQFRLHRYDSHLRQHTAQAEKAVALLNPVNEARMLLRLIYAALAEIEGAQIGAWETGIESCQELAYALGERTREIAQAVAGYTLAMEE